MRDHCNSIKIIIRKIYNRGRAPLAMGAGAIAEHLLSRHVQKRIEVKSLSPLRYVSMAGRKHWLLLRESLVSLDRSWPSLPLLTIISDGSWEKQEFLDEFRFWPGPIELLMPDDITAPLSNSGSNKLVQLAKQHPLGLKLAAIIYLAQKEQILFVDSDILWFSDPEPILAKFRDFSGPATGIETGGSFNRDLIQKHCPEVNSSSPYVNTGCVYLKGELCPSDLLESMLTTALEQPKNYFNEQSIIAVAVQRWGRRFPPNFCLVDFDALALYRNPWQKGYYACHYVNWVRHQFYRDAFWLRSRNFFKYMIFAYFPYALAHC
jgi:hypothetical protein